MKKCIDCKKKMTCGKANPIEICEDFEKMHGAITKLDEVDNGYYKFSPIEVVE